MPHRPNPLGVNRPDTNRGQQQSQRRRRVARGHLQSSRGNHHNRRCTVYDDLRDHTRIHTGIHTHIGTRTETNIRTHTYRHPHAKTHIQAHINAHLQTHIYRHIQTGAHIYTYIHTKRGRTNTRTHNSGRLTAALGVHGSLEGEEVGDRGSAGKGEGKQILPSKQMLVRCAIKDIATSSANPIVEEGLGTKLEQRKGEKDKRARGK